MSSYYICIGNYIIDKKIRELIKVCNTYEIKTPSKEQSILLLNNLLPTYSSEHEMINNYIQGDLRKLELVFNLINKSNQKLPVNKLIELIKNKINKYIYVFINFICNFNSSHFVCFVYE